MIKMLLADDEPVITRGIQMLVDWESMGIKVIGAYQDGKSALHAILTQQPDVALLDIQMPGMTGIEIIKELHAAGNQTQVVFISGFQDFAYARDAVKYNAVDYLLKPVNKNSLIEAVAKCIRTTKATELTQAGYNIQAEKSLPDEAYRTLGGSETTTYILVACEILGLAEKQEIEQRLISFSVFSLIDEHIRKNNLGVAFHKDKKICFICKGLSQDALYSCLKKLLENIKNSLGATLGCVISRRIETLADVPDLFNTCIPKLEYFYFADILPQHILYAEKEVFVGKKSVAQLHTQREQIAAAVMQQNAAFLQDSCTQFIYDVGISADGKRDAATYGLFCCLRTVEERLGKAGVTTQGHEAEALLDYARTVVSYALLSKEFTEKLTCMYEAVTQVMQKSGKRDILKATEYIQQHYAENLSLEVLANYIHMNSFYFSTYFKKQTGKNFKDYLNQVRMQRAMELLITTDKKSYEIADSVGYTDYRSFTELFSRYYGQTPAAYRKEHMQTSLSSDAG